ncbi:Stp1/IreP family PP2C-type Ser/Thr phosphatase [Aestuariicella sp. G3-2]|uniref:Stp1/IreP family PP2C-type Ser/Thr phosphatase n=1 Tax=Pseudomaricurvus albidus TaxID=2842452 RepID=UPI001C0DD763|nr:Stp1/IreP family PP2C-type Ser/Thr phosphatase [Aestuariicella albida]MBU3069847.1 Stp1/IreP family PP2C-type Ser/Thr phosphatase [Aestuariicella albida]
MPSTLPPRIAINGRTDIGQVRNENEDNIRWYSHPKLPFGYVVVADGMGGYTGGARASSIAVNCIGQHLESLISPTFQSCTPQQQELMIQSSLIEAINTANQEILAEKQINPQLGHMGTTVAMAVIWESQVTIAHLGDSRVYLWDKQGFVQLTKDHSLVQEMIDSGSLNEDQARTSDIRNQITKALGVTASVDPTINNFQLTQSCLMMLCSDGLTEYLDNGQLDYVLSTHRPALECCYRLIDDANLLGGKDNISVGIIEYTANPATGETVDNPAAQFIPPAAPDGEDVTIRKHAQ